jgi:hypothetical protein
VQEIPGLEEWLGTVKAALGVELDVDVEGLLDMTRTAAHNVARPAAPLTAFLVGYAAAAGGGGEQAVREALAVAVRLAEERAGERGGERG